MVKKIIQSVTGEQVLNNRPPDLENDFGISDEEDKLDKELMPDTTNQLNMPENKSDH